MADVRAGERADADRDRVARPSRRLSGWSSGAPRRDRLERVEDGRQLLVARRRRARAAARAAARRGRGDRGDDVADVAGDVGQHALVLDLAAVAAEVGDVLGQQRDAVRPAAPRRRPTARARAACGERTNAACSMPGPLDVDRVALRAGHARVASRQRLHRAPHLDRDHPAPVGGRAARVADRLDRARRSRGRSRLPARRRARRRPGSSCGRLGDRADDHAQPVVAARPRPPPRTAGPRSSASGTCGTTAALGRGRHAHLDQQLVGARCRSRSSRGSARRSPTSRSPRGERSTHARAERARASPAGRRRSRRRPARRRPSPGCAPAGSRRARTRAPAPASRRARRRERSTARWRGHRAEPQLAVDDLDPLELRARGRATAAPAAPGSPGS